MKAGSKNSPTRDANPPLFIGPGQTAVTAPKGLTLGSYYLSSTTTIFNHRLSKEDLSSIPFEFLPLAASSKTAISPRHLRQLQQATEEMADGRWESVYTPTRPEPGNNSGNGMTGIFLQRSDLSVTPMVGIDNAVRMNYHWPKVKEYTSRHRVHPGNYNYAIAYYKYREAFESAFDLMLHSMIRLNSGFLDKLLGKKRTGLYFGITDYYGDPDLIPDHLLEQVLTENPNPGAVSQHEYLDILRRYRELPLLPGNYHTDGIEKNFDVQGIFTINNKDVIGGDTLIRRRGLRRKRKKYGLRQNEVDVTVKLRCKEGHAGLWVPSWGRTEVEHTPGPVQGGHRTIIVFALDSANHELTRNDSGLRKHYGSHYETLSWDCRHWHVNGPPNSPPDKRLWRP